MRAEGRDGCEEREGEKVLSAGRMAGGRRAARQQLMPPARARLPSAAFAVLFMQRVHEREGAASGCFAPRGRCSAMWCCMLYASNRSVVRAPAAYIAAVARPSRQDVSAVSQNDLKAASLCGVRGARARACARMSDGDALCRVWRRCSSRQVS